VCMSVSAVCAHGYVHCYMIGTSEGATMLSSVCVRDAQIHALVVPLRTHWYYTHDSYSYVSVLHSVIVVVPTHDLNLTSHETLHYHTDPSQHSTHNPCVRE